jgi:sulfatase maturation enzyme AslB (radical SAM superfamily)
MCPIVKLQRPRGEMSFEIFQKVVDEIARENPATGLWFAFMGEPLLLGDRLIRMIEYAKQQGRTNSS